MADLQYCDAYEFAVGHSVATEALVNDEHECWVVRTCWIPQAEVARVAPAMIPGVELSMDVLGQLADATDAQTKLGAFVAQYRDWINRQRSHVPASPARRRATAEELLHRASIAANRIAQGIALLADPQVLEAFCIANRAMASAARQRSGVMQGKDPSSVQPRWRPFQLAFLLMNLPGIVDPHHDDREVVDLLFFPTGGGKTEAYLGLAAFTLVLRRLRHPGLASAGLSVLMRYTLRLLTLDQLGRAATLICALELERQHDVERLGTWPFEMGLWVGKAATPNVMGARGDGNSDSARARTMAFKNDDRKPSPIPLEECPWCGTKFKAASFQLLPDPDRPSDLRVTCMQRRCAFTRDHPLPILAVDEPIYRRLPCFMIATVDKFAAMPWTGEVGQFFGRVDRYDKEGFYGPCYPGKGQPLPVDRLLPPDLIIQDELHLISGPLGTMVGLYETARDELCGHEVGGHKVRAKIVASTATVRRAESQIRALFNHRLVEIFPPPDQEDPTAPPTGINAWQFPEWFITQDVNTGGEQPGVCSRMLVHRRELTRGKFIDQDKKRRAAVPVRFVRACRAGHIGDIDWYAYVHSGQTACRQRLWIDERGTSGDLAEVYVRCACGQERSMLHAFAHLLITAISLACGYPASSIRERIYALPSIGYGVLLYTGTTDAEGTLGGIIQVGRHIHEHVWNAVEMGELCSNDPVCAQHSPQSPHEHRFLHGAVCHGCVLIAETSCEQHNDFLDRALVVPTLDNLGAHFFPWPPYDSAIPIACRG